MTGGSLGLRTASYGSLSVQQQQQQQQQQTQNNPLLSNQYVAASPPRTVLISRKPVKMMMKEKERLVSWFCRFAGRKKVGMIFLIMVSLAALGRILCLGKGQDATVIDHATAIDHAKVIDHGPDRRLKKTTAVGLVPIFSSEGGNLTRDTSLEHVVRHNLQNPRPDYFKGYALPPGNPCETFKYPPPPTDRKRTGPRPCPVCYLSVEEAIGLMPNASSYSPVLRNLTYVYEEHSSKTEFGGSDFGGYPSLRQRNDSFDIKESMTVHCGFIRGPRPGHGTGFNIDDADLHDTEQCRGIVVASAIFGNFDVLRQPKNISKAAQENVCFFMFLDEETEQYMRNTSILDGSKKVGLWRIVLVRDLPYSDPRRSGKVPKLLLHRLFPNARYSIWMDGKLELVVDPYQILERFLWRRNTSFAISKHYRRFSVFVEAEANKAAGKYDNASIDFQIDFYRKEGLTPYSSAKLPIQSDVPEGCVIIREHIPISNLFTCLWFNEVDRFTSRDQLSFSTVRDKIRSKVDWTVDMFLDCERRNFVVQGYHRDVLEHMAPPVVILQHPQTPFLPPPPPPSPPPPAVRLQEKVSNKRPSAKRGKGKKRNRKVAAGSVDTS
ncbi:putative hexosyltransferase MUCI70 [Drosera capensis]